jgi:hypothetical protein
MKCHAYVGVKGVVTKITGVKLSPETHGYPQFRLSFPQIGVGVIITTTFVDGLQ